MLRATAEYNQCSASKGKALLANKDTKSLNLIHALLSLVKTMSTKPPLALIVSLPQQNFSTISRDWPFNSVHEHFSSYRFTL